MCSLPALFCLLPSDREIGAGFAGPDLSTRYRRDRVFSCIASLRESSFLYAARSPERDSAALKGSKWHFELTGVPLSIENDEEGTWHDAGRRAQREARPAGPVAAGRGSNGSVDQGVSV